MIAGPIERAGFIEAPEDRAAEHCVEADSARRLRSRLPSPTGWVSVATAMITNIRKKLSTSSQRNDCPCDPLGRGGANVGDVAERTTQDRRGRRGPPRSWAVQ